ncbi:hypothetical protein [Kitasatospora griseola]|uniref:hypothetical protein n=1 Tax=Kitasatospora griseola TaxID=2064 RepID=UPI0034254045
MNGTRGAGRSGRGVAYALLTLLGCGVLVGLAAHQFGGSPGMELVHSITPTAMILAVALNFRTRQGGVAAFVAGVLAAVLSMTGVDAVRAQALAADGQQVVATVTAVHRAEGSSPRSCDLRGPDGADLRYPLSPCPFQQVGQEVRVTADPHDRQAPVTRTPDPSGTGRTAMGLLAALVLLIASLPFWAARRPPAAAPAALSAKDAEAAHLG